MTFIWEVLSSNVDQDMNCIQVTEVLCNLKVSHPRCVVKIQVREENPILYSHKTQLNIKLSFITTLQQHVSA